LPRKEQVEFFSILGKLTKAGYSINESINFLSVLWRKKKYINKIKNDLNKGNDFVLALKNKIDDNYYLQLETSLSFGKFSESLIRISSQIENQVKQINKINQISKYPIFLLGMLICLLIGINVFIKPMISDMSGIKQQENFLFLVPLFITVIFIIIAYFIFINLSKIKQMKLMLLIPFLHGILYSLFNFNFATIISNGLLSGIEISSLSKKLSQNSKKSIQSEISKLFLKGHQSGKKIEDIMHGIGFVDETIIIYFIRGQTKEQIGKDLEQFSKIMYLDFLKKTDAALGLLQPLFFVVIGVIVVFMYLTMLSPMYKMIGNF
jgi:competence protein ComGB